MDTLSCSPILRGLLGPADLPGDPGVLHGRRGPLDSPELRPSAFRGRDPIGLSEHRGLHRGIGAPPVRSGFRPGPVAKQEVQEVRSRLQLLSGFIQQMLPLLMVKKKLHQG